MPVWGISSLGFFHTPTRDLTHKSPMNTTCPQGLLAMVPCLVFSRVQFQLELFLSSTFPEIKRPGEQCWPPKSLDSASALHTPRDKRLENYLHHLQLSCWPAEGALAASFGVLAPCSGPKNDRESRFPCRGEAFGPILLIHQKSPVFTHGGLVSNQGGWPGVTHLQEPRGASEPSGT